MDNKESLPIITINPNASTLCLLRKWPSDKYVQLVDTMMRKYPKHLHVLIGSMAEYDYVESICTRCQNNNGQLINAAGKINIRQLLALLEKTDILISNDSGPVHLAAGYKTKTVVMFGPETPVLYKPLNENSRILYGDIYCSPCINVLDNKNFEMCQHVRCLEEISVDDILKAVESLLENSSDIHEKRYGQL
jgi:ADP-heptose:LPS heptosyltransferase